MSKIVDREIVIPKDIDVLYEDKQRNLFIKGKNGSFVFNVHYLVNLKIENEILKTIPSNTSKESKSLAGTANSLFFNAIKGANQNYEKILEVRGVGYKVSTLEKKIIISAGYSHDVNLEIPSDLNVECLNNSKIIIRGCDKQKVGFFASKIRDVRRPNIFVKSLKGIFYQEEISNFKVKPGKRDSKK